MRALECLDALDGGAERALGGRAVAARERHARGFHAALVVHVGIDHQGDPPAGVPKPRMRGTEAEERNLFSPEQPRHDEWRAFASPSVRERSALSPGAL